MSDARLLSTPIAILIGSVIIAAGLFFGLRGREPAPAAPPSAAAAMPTESPPPAPTSPIGEPPRPQPGSAPGGPTASREQVTARAAKALEAHRATLVERCWKPSVAKTPDPPSSKFVWNFTFDAAGNQVIRGISADRDTARNDVTSCITDALPPIAVAAPGAPVYVDVPFSLP